MKLIVLHKKCGAQCGWFVGPKYFKNMKARSEDFERMDGTKPAKGEKFIESCPDCGEKINTPENMFVVSSSK